MNKKTKQLTSALLIFLLLSDTMFALSAKASNDQLQLVQQISEPVTLGFLSNGSLINSSKSDLLSVGFGNNSNVLQSTKSKFISVKTNDPLPILLDKNGNALINIAPSIGVAPQIVTFDANNVTDSSTLSFKWDFGDGEKSSEKFTTHIYNAPGKYNVTLTAKNEYNKSSSITKQIEIRDKNLAPEGSFETNLISDDVPLEIKFTSMVTDEENDEISYLWNFGDGGTSTEISPKHTYAIPGEYKPILTVKDPLGAVTNISSINLNLLPPNNTPVAQATAIPQNSTLTLNNTGLFTSIIQFLSNGTYDPDEETLTYLWEFGDGETSTESNPKHEYLNAGEYNAKLTVEDERKGQDTKEIKITISKPPPNITTTIDKTTGNAPFEVIFNSSSSQDYDGRAITLKWDFGDGTQQITDSTNGTIKHTYLDPGVYLVTLTAITPDNRSKTINPGNIIVVPGNAPVASITRLEGDTQGVIGKAKVKLSAAGSYDPDTQLPFKYKWLLDAKTFDTNGNIIDISNEINLGTDNNEETFDYTFTQAGQYIPVLEIEKADGSKHKFFGETFTITNNDGPIAVTKITSDLTDIKPGTEVGFDGSESYNTKANGNINQFIWDFGDGEKSTEISPKHIFTKEGSFTPLLIIVDNENQIGFAQTATIKISKQPEEVSTNINNSLSRKVLLQTADPNTETSSQEENDLLIQSMIQEAINTSISNDNIKPEIGQITLKPNTASPGDKVKLSAFIRDNIALSNFGYRLIDPSGNTIDQKVQDLTSEDKVLKDEFYIEEIITVPEDAITGTYKINLTATDTSQNQIAQASTDSKENEEISVTLEVKNNDSDKTTLNKILIPSEVTEIVSENRSRILNVDSKEQFAGFYLRDQNINTNDLIKQRKLLLDKDTEIRYLTNGFEVTGINSVINPWLSISPSTMNSLILSVISERSGYIETGTKGSLPSTYFRNWTSTNVYVDGKKVGNINWLSGAGISFDSNTANTTRFVQFRPVNRSGIEMPSETWTGNNFIFSKNLTPEITDYSPKETLAGRGAFDLYIYGNNFTQSSKVYFGSYLLTPYAASSNQLIVRVPANLIKHSGTQYLFIVNSNNTTSYTYPFIIKENFNVCGFSKTLPQTYWGADSRTILDGNNTYLTSPTATIHGNGSVTIPFCLDKDYDVNVSARLTHRKAFTSSGNSISFWLDNRFIGGSILYNNESLSFNNINTSLLSSNQQHELRINFSGGINDELILENVTFTENSGPAIDTISPASISLEGANRILSIYGRYFDQNTIVQIDNQQVNKTLINSSLINVTLPDKFSTPGLKKISTSIPGKPPSETYLIVRDKIEITNGSFKITPVQPFPGSSFDIELEAFDKFQDNSSTYTADIGIFDPDGNLLTISNISSYSTIKLQGIKNSDGTILFKGSIPLSINSKAGVYKAIVSVQKSSSLGTDYSSIEAFKYIIGKALGLSINDLLVPISHKLTFTPNPAVNIIFGIEENNSDTVGFVRTANKLIQSNQSIKFKALISNGTEHSEKIRYNFKSGDGRESGLIANDNFTFTYTNTDISSTTPLIYLPRLDIFWVENGSETKITTLSGSTILIYPNYKPIASARLLKENYPTYATNTPLKTAFIDNGSYDPNQIFSRAVDYVDSLKNDWKLYELKINSDEKLISLPVDAQISDDKKTFITGNLYSPGTYFAKLTVTDETGLTDTASTESVTLTRPSQKSIVSATTNPPDKKVFDPKTDSAGQGIPVQFSSNVTVLGGGSHTKSYRWDFGDGSCTNALLSQNKDCTSPNPIHYYSFTDRKSVTPKLTVTTRFANGLTETWEASAGTITFNPEPNFILLDITPDKTDGTVPFTVSFMTDPLTAKAVNATISKYEIDYKDGSIESEDITFNDLINKTFTHTYTTPGNYTPKLTVFTSNNSKKFEFNIPTITANATGQSGVFLLDDLSSLSFTNQPLVTFMVITAFPNPYDPNNSLRIKVKDEDGIENSTEVDSSKSSHTISLAEGKNSYYFESSDSSAYIWISEVREIVVDTTDPALSNISASLENEIVTVLGNIVEQNLEKVEIQTGEGVPLILSSDDITSLNNEDKEYKFNKLINFNNSYQNILIRVYDLAGNLSERSLQLNKQNSTLTLKHLESQENKSCLLPTQNVSNIFEHLNIDENKSHTVNLKCPVTSGLPFNLNLFTCFSDDGGIASTTSKSLNDVEVFFDIDNPKFEISYNNSPFTDTTDSFLKYALVQSDKCFDIKDFGVQYLKNSCSEEVFNPCTRTCAKLDGNPICNANIFSSSNLNNYNKNTLFSDLFTSTSESNNPSSFDPLRQWNVGHYEIKLTGNLNPISLQNYGTTFGKDANTPRISETFTYSFDIKRNMGVEEHISPESKKLPYNEDKEIFFKLIAIDSINFTTDRKPSLDLENIKWTGSIEPISPLTQIISESIDQNDPRRYTLELKTKLKATSLKKITLEIPIIFPPDYFNPTGISDLAKITFDKIIANFDADILSPDTGSLISGKTNITSQVLKPNLIGGLNSFDNCKKSVINYGIKLFGKEDTVSIAKKSLEVNPEKVSSKGSETISKIIFKDLINFNLKNIERFKSNFLSGNIFGPLELFAEYSTSCSDKNLEYSSNPKTFILLDNLLITKTKCKHPENFLNTICEVYYSSNTNYNENTLPEVEFIPNTGTVDQANCKVTYEDKNKLTKKASITCLPKEATNIEIKLKRNPNFLNEIDKKISFYNISNPSSSISTISNNENAIIADSEIVTVKQTQDEENQIGAFEINDPDTKTASFNGKDISVKELKDLLYEIKLLPYTDYILDKYTEETNQAYWKFICILQEAKGSTLDPNLRLQTAENPLKCTISHYEGYPDIKYIEDVSAWKDFIEGLKTKVGDDLSAYVNPTSIGTLAAFIAWNSILPINAWIILVAGFVGTSVDVTIRINDVKDLWNNNSNPNYTKTSNWKIGYSIGTLLTAVPGLFPASISKNIKVAEVTGKLDNFAELQGLIINEQRKISEISDTILQTQKQEKLITFVEIVDKLTDDGKRITNQVVQRFTDRGFDRSLIINKLGLTSTENIAPLVKVINRDGLAIPLTDQELNDLLFVIAKNVKEERVNTVVERVTGNLINGKLPENINNGKRILREDAALQVLSGERTLSNPTGETFCVDSNEVLNISTKELINKLGLDSVEDIKRFIGQKIYIFELPLNNLNLEPPFIGSENFIKGGITSGGELEFIIKYGWPSSKLNKVELEQLGVKIYEKEKLVLTENDVRDLINNSLDLPTEPEMELLITALKESGLI